MNCECDEFDLRLLKCENKNKNKNKNDIKTEIRISFASQANTTNKNYLLFVIIYIFLDAFWLILCFIFIRHTRTSRIGKIN